MTKIAAEHLARGAFVYVRQSTTDQVRNNHESRRRQYGLADRARALGWSTVEVIDDDLGRSGSGVSRPGFEKLLAAICEGRVGAVVSIEASRLARNGRDWHTLLEFCGLVGTLIVDEDGVYDPRHPNDRLLLGMKGTMSEMELSIFRQRSLEALKQKARRGELFLNVAVGYAKTAHDDRIEKDPDRRVQEAIALVFRKFAEMQTACLESTGRYSLGIACALYEAGHVVSIINPAQIRDFVPDRGIELPSAPARRSQHLGKFEAALTPSSAHRGPSGAAWRACPSNPSGCGLP